MSFDVMLTSQLRSPTRAVAAVDLGASSGRVVLGLDSVEGVSLEIVARFAHALGRNAAGQLVWDIDGIWREVLRGLRAANDRARAMGLAGIESVGVDAWGHDYAVIDSDGRRTGDVVSYRDPRTRTAVTRVESMMSSERLFRATGAGRYSFNTIFQLASDDRIQRRDARVLLVADYLTFLLTGKPVTEVSNAATTGLLDVATRSWASTVFDAVSLRTELFAPLTRPGDRVGEIRADVASLLGLRHSVEVVAVGSHDTASALSVTPGTTPTSAYVSAGTWSVIGVRPDEPVFDYDALAEGFTNQLDGELEACFHRTEPGAWLVNETLRSLHGRSDPDEVITLHEKAAALPADRVVFDVTDSSLREPGDMAERIRTLCAGAGGALADDVGLIRAITDSLAHRYADTIRRAHSLAGLPPTTNIDVSGGASRNRLLWDRVGELTGTTISPAAVEATAFGNVRTQLRASRVRRSVA